MPMLNQNSLYISDFGRELRVMEVILLLLLDDRVDSPSLGRILFRRSPSSARPSACRRRLRHSSPSCQEVTDAAHNN